MNENVGYCEIRFSENNVPYFLGESLEKVSYEFLQRLNPSKILLVIDMNLQDFAKNYIKEWRKGFPISEYVIVAQESNKSSDTLNQLLSWAISESADRRSIIVAIGGGITGNIAGLAAHLLFRGVPLIHLPTTYMAAFDSVLSQKQAVNGNRVKNCVGAFHIPAGVFCDINAFRTLSTRDIRAGIAETVKNALVVTPEQIEALFQLSSNIELYGPEEHKFIWEVSLAAKLPTLKNDPQEKGHAIVFEYGHTVGHALEAASIPLLRHGEAVSIGLLAAAKVAESKLGLKKEVVQLHFELLNHFGLPVKLDNNIPIEQIRNFLLKDNKRGYLKCSADEIAMVLLKDLGEPIVREGLPLEIVSLENLIKEVLCLYI